MINPAEISVVVQGPLTSPDAQISTLECLQSIRKHLPRSEIILSTWKGSNSSGLDYDQLILSDDPGAPRRPDGVFYNVNRMIVSTRAGIISSTRPYIVKIRTDCRLDGSNFLNLSRSDPKRTRRFLFFNERILACELYFRNPAKRIAPHLFNPSDVFYFGLADDLRIGDLPLQITPKTITDWSEWPSSPEQYIWITFLNHAMGLKVDLKHLYDFSISKAIISEISIINNFAIYSADEIGLIMPSKLTLSHSNAVYTHAEWKYLANACRFPLLISARMTTIYCKRVACDCYQVIRCTLIGKYRKFGNKLKLILRNLGF